MIKPTKQESDRIRSGDLNLLKEILEKLDQDLVKGLRCYKEDVRFLQGAAQLTEALLKILQ
jgi:hypothetical protein